MREIKFRGRRIDNGKWVYGVPVESINGRVYMIVGATEDAVNTKNDVDFIFIEVEPDTIGQYTGLKDKNGCEIFEGDIISYRSKNYQVVWDRYRFKLKLFYQAWMDYPDDAFSELSGEDMAVIGNIYDNPELLEAKNGN